MASEMDLNATPGSLYSDLGQLISIVWTPFSVHICMPTSGASQLACFQAIVELNSMATVPTYKLSSPCLWAVELPWFYSV